MPGPSTTQAITINSGDTVSTAFEYHGKGPVGLWCPVVDSGNWYIKASYDTTSANYVRLQNAVGSGTYQPIIQAGSKSFDLDDIITAFSSFKLETDTAQADNRTFRVVTKP